jgi:hypothetical protein
LIWGYRFTDIERYLADLGFVPVEEVAEHVLFLRGADVTIRKPNVLGMLPENLVNDAFDSAGLPPPTDGADSYVD